MTALSTDHSHSLQGGKETKTELLLVAADMVQVLDLKQLTNRCN